MASHRIMSLLLVSFAGMAMCTNGTEQLTNSTEYNLITDVTNNNTEYTTFTETMTTGFILPDNISCQEGSERGNPPANETCDCGSLGYFYGNYCQNVDLDEADDINTSKRVMEIQWGTDPNFTREYLFVYRESDSNDAPLTQPLILKQGSGYFYAWLTYLKSGEVQYIVCVMEEKFAGNIIGNDDYWTRLDADNLDCVTIQTQLSVTQEQTLAAILVGVGMGITLIIIFTANLCVNRQKNVLRAEDEYSDRVEQTMVLTQDMNVMTQQEYLEMYDRIQYTPESHAM